MPQEDKIKREIDQLGKLLAKLLSDLTGLKSSMPEEQLQELKQTLQDKLMLDLDILTKSSKEEFEKYLAERKIENSHLEQLADIFYQLAEHAGSKEEARGFYEKALSLYESLSLAEASYSLDRHYKMEKIKQIL